ncbi:MFS transporter, putative metabolite transport protein [Pseudomonas flavescens]|uniref:MFS transporter, putative metabolite transport protein n=1 Tax=Phytopseudomonas flavescens TaxID=29435 RepID=A0A1G8P7W2_9GAMM|nr:MFS transporter, putative metabolite transport protein [Pseudomonas flavescens]
MTTFNTSIEDIPLNRFHQLLTLRSGGGSFVDGYVLSIIGVCMMQMTAAMSLSSFWQGMIAASALIGIFFGGVNRPGFPRHFPSSGNSAFQNPLAIAA